MIPEIYSSDELHECTTTVLQPNIYVICCLCYYRNNIMIQYYCSWSVVEILGTTSCDGSAVPVPPSRQNGGCSVTIISPRRRGKRIRQRRRRQQHQQQGQWRPDDVITHSSIATAAAAAAASLSPQRFDRHSTTTTIRQTNYSAVRYSLARTTARQPPLTSRLCQTLGVRRCS